GLVEERPRGARELARDRPGPLEQRPVETDVREAEVGRAVLAGAEELPAAAQVEVDFGELEAVGRGDERVESALRGLGQLLLRAGDEQAVRLLGAPADAAAQLMELGEPEAIGLLDDHHG